MLKKNVFCPTTELKKVEILIKEDDNIEHIVFQIVYAKYILHYILASIMDLFPIMTMLCPIMTILCPMMPL
jgi:hypothetical protein